MKKIGILLVGLIVCISVNAQSPAVKQVGESVFTLTTFGQDGSIIASSRGIFVNNNGEAISLWTPFIGASKATVIDAKGNTMEVESIVGANSVYNVCKFRVKGTTNAAKLSTVAATASNDVWLVGYSVGAPTTEKFTIASVEKFMTTYNYYIFSATAPDNMDGCPLVNQSGAVIGLLQHSLTLPNDVYSTDANYTNSLAPTGFTINDPTLTKTNIRTALPDKEDDALLTLMLSLSKNDSIKRIGYIQEFIKKFPSLSDGYTAYAQEELNGNDFAAAASQMELAIKNATKKDEAHSNYAKIIYQKETYKPEIPYSAWSFDKALDQAKQAYSINPLPIYKHQQAQIIFGKGDYATAYDMFIELTKTPMRNGELFYEAAQCKTQLQASATEIMELLDSAVAASPQPLDATGAPYVLARGTQWQTMENYRNAVKDYNLYDTLMYGRPISSEFYYAREQCEIKINQNQQALNDMSRAILLSPQEPTYWAENASLNLRFNRLDVAIKSAQRCIELAPEYSDAYIVLGLAQIQNNDKITGLATLQKAKELNDPRAEDLINKYK